MARIEDLVILTQFTPGRALYALNQMTLLAEPEGPLGGAIGDAMAAAGRLTQIEARWASREATSGAHGQAAQVDAMLDRAVSVLHGHLAGRVTLFGEADARGKLAADLLLRYLPGGVEAITQRSFKDELALVDRVVASLRGRDAAAVTTLQFAPIVEALSDRADLLRAELAKAPSHTIEFDAVREARAALQRALTLVVAHAITAHSAPAQADAFAALMAPLMSQMERIRALRARRRPVLDVDPGTGLEQGPPA